MKKVLSPRKEFIKLFDSFQPQYHAGMIWSDFLTLTACSLLEPICVIRPGFRESDTAQKATTEIKRIRDRYDTDEISALEQMFSHIVMELESNPWQDLLGSLWSELEVNSQTDKQFKGQFFTPFHVSQMMAEVSMTGMSEVIDQKGYITLSEPACGAGGMITAVAKVLFDRGYNPQKVLHVTAQDIDINCVYMTYIQMSLLGLPGIVIHGDTISNTCNSSWPTVFHPLYFWDVRFISGMCD